MSRYSYVETLTIPDLSGYRLHRAEEPAVFEGVPVPGLSARFYRRDDDGRLASVGQYFYHGRELLRAWGYVDEHHCRFSAVCGVDGVWDPPVAGCPTVKLIHEGERVVGFQVQAADGSWAGDATPPGPHPDRGGPRAVEWAIPGSR